LNAPTKLMKEEGYGAGYIYDHNEPEGFSGQDYWPEGLGRQRLYRPVDRGMEKDIGARLAHWAKLRKGKAAP
ncbi:MAG TPA: replication-associated recombination protein A, partial [Methylocella sp.]|nr:replication-associated recombination protein A [Methylocella sp.]